MEARGIDQSQKSNNAPVPYPTMPHFVTEMCTCVAHFKWMWEKDTVKCHYNACHYNANASLTRSILGSQTAPSWPSPSGSAHGLKVWNHRGLIGHSGNDTPLFPYKWNKTKVSHLLVMSIQSIHDWSSIKHTDYSSPVLRECHQQANMAARRPDVENNLGSNQVNISHEK